VTITSWRITKARHAAAAFTGAGAKTFGGRWNSPGTALIYTAGSRSLALLEMLVHLEVQDLLRRYVIFPVTFDDALLSAVDPAGLPKTWRRSPAPASLQAIGDMWAAAGTSAVLRVPSAIVPGEANFLLNPAHRDFARIALGPRQTIAFDPRLIKLPPA
jgi:RES domain-containing protein